MPKELTSCDFGQIFGANANPLYAGGGLYGHPGVDISCGYGSLIEALATGVVYSMYTPERPANDGYTAIYTVCQTALEMFELSYGHVSQIDVKIGDYVYK